MSRRQERLPILLPCRAIQRRIREMGAEISRDFRGQPVHFVAVLKSAVVFFADLLRCVQVKASVDFVCASSYGKGTQSAGPVNLLMDLHGSVEQRNVVLVEDILDTGRTTNFLLGLLRQRHPKVLRVAALLDKPAGRIEPVRADYLGFSIPNRFVVGYGLDCAERYRNLPDIRFLPGGEGIPCTPRR
jgi:hypoxanthine phosphoribosyltransferase